MPSVAKKMLEKFGWKEGEGLGKDRAGVKTYVKVVRRDPKAAAGLGHGADPSTGTSGSLASQLAVELDSIYGEIKSDKKKKAVESSDSDSDDVSVGDDTPTRPTATKRRRNKSPSTSSSSDSEEDDGEEVVPKADVTRMSDDELLRRCGGVRLGRAGRHRFFDGKLSRIEKSHKN